MLPHDVAGEREAEAGALVGGLGGEERIEDLVDDVLGNATAVVADHHLEAVVEALRGEAQRRLVVAARRLPPLVDGIASVGGHVEEDAAQVLGDHRHRAHVGVEVLVDGQLEVGIGRPRRVEGKLGVLGEQGVEVGGLALAAVAPHRQHVAHDAVGAVAVVADAAEILRQVLIEFVEQLALLVVQRLARLLQRLVEFFEKLLRGFGEVLHEIERVLDLVGDAGRELAKRRELLLRHHLILGALQIGQRPLQLLVLAAQLLGEFLHQIEALHFERVAPEHFQRPGHVRHLVAPLDLHLRL